MFFDKTQVMWPDKVKGPWKIRTGKSIDIALPNFFIIISHGDTKEICEVINNNPPFSRLLSELAKKESELGVKLPSEEEVKEIVGDYLISAVEDAVCDSVISS